MISLPKTQNSADNVLFAMRLARKQDVKWQEGKTWSLVFNAGDEINRLTKQAYTMFFSENGLNPMAFPSLKKFEAEVVSMTASILGGNEETAGNMTSGGTESILMAVKTAREWAKVHKPDVTRPEMILPLSAHPAFEKAAHYFGVTPVHTAITAGFQADVGAVAEALSPNTILIVGSAPSYPQGMVDPIPEMARIAQQANILFHVDACVGGFILPFIRKLGYLIPDFDFSVPGVTSISVDLHKYGYAAKGASVILYKDKALRRHQYFVYTGWTGGIYASPTMTGTRPGGAIAAAWAVLNFLGEEGYLEITRAVMETTEKLKAGINAIDGLKVLGNPPASILAIASDTLNIYEVGDEMTLRGWHFDRQQNPPCLHLTVTPASAYAADKFLADLGNAAVKARRFSLNKLMNSLQVGLVKAAVKLLPEETLSALTAKSSSMTGFAGGDGPQRQAAMYGMMASLPNRGDLDELVLDILDQLTSLPDPNKK